MNLYVHFPFCRRKCTYCALHSRAGSDAEARARYAEKTAESIASCGIASGSLSTVYFGGGSPALCDLKPVFGVLSNLLSADAEFTVELHPLDVTGDKLSELKNGGVNRVSMGLQSLDDATLTRMGRGYSFAEAERAFAMIKDVFDNAGVDLIAGYPSQPRNDIRRLAGWGLRHCSLYSLILEEKSILAKMVERGEEALPGDDETLDEIRESSHALSAMGLRRYEISNYAVPGFECRHNMAVWRGEDYMGIGEGAYGRVGLSRTISGKVESVMTPEQDTKERRLFSLRTIEGLDAADRPEWIKTLDHFARQGLVCRQGSTYRLTERGTEVCDSILAELV